LLSQGEDPLYAVTGRHHHLLRASVVHRLWTSGSLARGAPDCKGFCADGRLWFPALVPQWRPLGALVVSAATRRDSRQPRGNDRRPDLVSRDAGTADPQPAQLGVRGCEPTSPAGSTLTPAYPAAGGSAGGWSSTSSSPRGSATGPKRCYGSTRIYCPSRTWRLPSRWRRYSSKPLANTARQCAALRPVRRRAARTRRAPPGASRGPT
jgi:hypothetical protein